MLTIHEDEIKRLKEEKRLKAPILASVKKYFDICNEEKDLAASASDQSRLTGRGQRGDPGRLLREEKMRKRVQKEKPRVSEFLHVDMILAHKFAAGERTFGFNPCLGRGQWHRLPHAWRKHSASLAGDHCYI